MRKILFLPAILAVFASCSKQATIHPDVTTVSAITKKDTATIITKDSAAIFHSVSLVVLPQTTKISITDSSLNLAYTQSVVILITAQSYEQSYSIHLSQDLSASALSKLDFTTTTNSGESYYDWADDNLNNIDQKTMIDTAINNVAMKKIHVMRNFNFVKKFANIQLATTAKATLLTTTTDKVTYSSYVLYDKAYPSTVITAKINYVQ